MTDHQSDENDPVELDGPLVDIAAPGDISADERFKLWVAAGARCAFCKRYLLENETTGDPVLIGEAAHVVGRSTTRRSPRGRHPLPLGERNKAANLILACPNEHTTIDKKTGQLGWQSDDLRRLKLEHEADIRALTGMTRDRETTVLRVAGTIRGTVPSISKPIVHQAVHADLRFPQYRLGPVASDLEIDLVTNLGEEDERYFECTSEVLARRMAQIGDQVAAGEVGHVSLFALARIPVLVQLGHVLDDKWPVDVYPFDRLSGTWEWTDGQAVGFSTVRIAGDPGADRVTLILSLSGHVTHADIPAELLHGSAVYEMTPIDAEPSVTLFRVRETLIRFADAYLAFLALVERDHSTATFIDVIPAIGLTPAIELGRRRTRAKRPALRIWDQTTTPRRSYTLATEIGP